MRSDGNGVMLHHVGGEQSEFMRPLAFPAIGHSIVVVCLTILNIIGEGNEFL